MERDKYRKVARDGLNGVIKPREWDQDFLIVSQRWEHARKLRDEVLDLRKVPVEGMSARRADGQVLMYFAQFGPLYPGAMTSNCLRCSNDKSSYVTTSGPSLFGFTINV